MTVRQGKAHLIGGIVEAQWTARDRRLERFRTEQPPYSLLVRGIELDVLPTVRRHGMGILTYSPLAGGWLSGSWSADSSPTSPARQRLAARFDMTLPDNHRKLEAVQQLAEAADDAGVPLIELAIAFVVNLLLDPGTRAGSSKDIEIDEPTADELRVHFHARRLRPSGGCHDTGWHEATELGDHASAHG